MSPSNMLPSCLDFFGERNTDNKEDIGFFDGKNLNWLRALINKGFFFLGFSLKKNISLLHGLKILDLKTPNAFTFISNK